jgi:hypothetical protein
MGVGSYYFSKHVISNSPQASREFRGNEITSALNFVFRGTNESRFHIRPTFEFFVYIISTNNAESGRTTSVLRKREAILEDGLRVWHPGDDDPNPAKVVGANLPIDGGGTGAIHNGRN